jgi:hypothetical protein
MRGGPPGQMQNGPGGPGPPGGAPTPEQMLQRMAQGGGGPGAGADYNRYYNRLS